MTFIVFLLMSWTELPTQIRSKNSYSIEAVANIRCKEAYAEYKNS